MSFLVKGNVVLDIIAITMVFSKTMYGNIGRTIVSRGLGTYFQTVYLFICRKIIAYSIMMGLPVSLWNGAT